jgi:RNA 3'-terminal phosphate cyclase (ATP)
MEFVHIDGAAGGGQILRSALSLSMLTGRPFHVRGIRKGRAKPGLMRQHLTCVRAAEAVCGARVEGAELGASELAFVPGPVRAGCYELAVGTAGSTGLVLQTLLPPLMVAEGPSQLTVAGGTHNPLAPSYHFLDRVFFPLLERMGVGVARSIERAGFYPAGGGLVRVAITPTPALSGFSLAQRGAHVSTEALSLIASVPGRVAERELAVVGARLALAPAALRVQSVRSPGPGNALLLDVRHAEARELITVCGERGLAAEVVAQRALDELARYLESPAPVGEHLADQLLIPLAMAGSGGFCTRAPTDHLRTNVEVIRQFLPVRFSLVEREGALYVDVTAL